MGKLLILSITDGEEQLLDKLKDFLAEAPGIEIVEPPATKHTLTFPGLELCLDVNQQIDIWRFCLLDRLLTGCMLLLTGEDSQQMLQGVAITQTVQAGHFAPAGELQTVGFAALGYFTAGFPE